MTGGAFQFTQIMRQFQYGDKLYGNFLGTFLKKIRNFRILPKIPAWEVKWIGLP